MSPTKYYMDRREAKPWTICYIILNMLYCFIMCRIKIKFSYLISYLTCKSVRRHVFVIVYLRQKTSSAKIRKKTLYWSGPVHLLNYWPVNIRKYWAASQTKTNRENKNLKYNIQHYYQFMNYYRDMWCCFEIFFVSVAFSVIRKYHFGNILHHVGINYSEDIFVYSMFFVKILIKYILHLAKSIFFYFFIFFS